MIWEFFIISRIIRNRIASIFNNPDDNVLDIGCGKNPRYHKSIKGNLTCFDKHKTTRNTIVGDADEMYKYFHHKAFDKIISVNSFYYFKNPFNVTRYIHKIMKNKGIFVIVVPFFYPVHDIPEDKFRFTEYGIKNVLNGYFTIEEIKPIGGIFNLPAILIHSLIKGFPLVFPKPLRGIAKITMIVFYPFYIIAQLISVLDIFDRTKRFPTYYFVVARKN